MGLLTHIPVTTLWGRVDEPASDAARLPRAVFADGTWLQGPARWVDRTAGVDPSARPHHQASRRWISLAHRFLATDEAPPA
jgi:hypothetical protein